MIFGGSGATVTVRSLYDCEAQLTKECKLLKADYESRPQTTAWARHPHDILTPSSRVKPVGVSREAQAFGTGQRSRDAW